MGAFTESFLFPSWIQMWWLEESGGCEGGGLERDGERRRGTGETEFPAGA